MPELPDVTVYVEKLSERIIGTRLEDLTVYSTSILKTVSPRPQEFVDQKVVNVGRLGKRVWWEMESGAVALTHLMIAGRFLWKDGHPTPPLRTNKVVHWVAQFEPGELQLTEASPKKRASLHLLSSKADLSTFDRGGVDPFTATTEDFAKALLAENRTLKRAMTNPARFDGIGNAYSDEILHAARLSPLRLTQNLTSEEISRLHKATKSTLAEWIDRLRNEFQGKFPGRGQITAFRPDFAVHGKYGEPCPVCGTPVQRIRYADNETNYCAVCQNEGRLLADRSLSRLLKSDWPKTVEELYVE